VAELFRRHLARITPPGVAVTIRELHAGLPWRARTEGPLYRHAAQALEHAFGRPPVYAGSGGSIPIVSDFERALGAPVLLMGFGLPGANAHAPNEWMSLDSFAAGMRAAAALLSNLGGQAAPVDDADRTP
jgi:acetylornithine deacetylase/succinyl-diaminopimelate desuccinylase-like protein